MSLPIANRGEIVAPLAGTVDTVLARVEDQVAARQVLLEITP